MITNRPLARGACVLLALFAAPSLAPAQVKYPPLPEKVDVQIRYRIRADRDERVRQFRGLEAHLKKLGFERKRQPDDDLDILDPAAERFEGTIPSKNVFAILEDPRVQTVLFKPTDLQYPDDPAKPVSVRLRIATGYLPAEQQRLHRQVVARLARLGFREAIGYDTDRYTLVRGDLPYFNLFRLLKDLRTEPAGWFLPDVPAAELPSPLRDTLPVRVVEVLANADLDLLNPPPVPPNRIKYTPDLRAVLDDAAALSRPIRVEAVMDHPVDGTELDLIRNRLRSAYTRLMVNPATQDRELTIATLEGGVGNIVTIEFPQAADVERFASEPGVAVVRLPRAGVQTVAPIPAGGPAPVSPAQVLSDTRAAAFHQLGYRGQGTRVVVVATEFPDLATGMGFRFLDKSLRTPVVFIDLTAELSRELLPTPPAANPTNSGTVVARAAHLAAPDAGIILVRVDPAAFFQVYTVARFVRGGVSFSEAMQSRVAELTQRTDDLRRRDAEAVEEYRRAFQNLSDELRPMERREQAKKALDLLILEETKHAAAIGRATLLQNSMQALAGADVVVNTLVWETGFPLDGLSELSQVIDTSFASEALAAPLTRSATRPRPAPRPLWVQAASPSVGSVWGGPFVDPEQNGVMEFAGPAIQIPAGEWSRELNFLAVRGPDASITPTLPTGTKVRLTVQWRETHDPATDGGSDSIFPLTLRVFHQLDPEGKVRASDELKEIARSVGNPYRVVVEPTYGVYEQIVEFTVPADGRYCLMIEGQTVYDPRLPALQRQIEVRPRVFSEFVTTTQEKGRPVFASFVTKAAGVGIPGDARSGIAVAPDTDGLTGGGTGVELLTKPDLTAPGAIALGTAKVGGAGVSAGFAGGILAALVGSGAPPSDVIRATGLQRGGPAVISEGWLRVVPVRSGSKR
ncbi:MAG: hypothetical protein JWO38_844 [Gemmataceae bacterium]|nr:hypothetical protein [Gemmataceae bacterium]